MRPTTKSTKGRSIGHCSQSPDCSASVGVLARAWLTRARASAGVTASSTSSRESPSLAMISRYVWVTSSSDSPITKASFTYGAGL